MQINAGIDKEIRKLKNKWLSSKTSEKYRNEINARLLELEEVRKTFKQEQKQTEKSKKEASRKGLRKKQIHSLQVDISETKAYEEKVNKLLQDIRKIITKVEEDTDREHGFVQKLKLYR